MGLNPFAAFPFPGRLDIWLVFSMTVLRSGTHGTSTALNDSNIDQKETNAPDESGGGGAAAVRNHNLIRCRTYGGYFKAMKEQGERGDSFASQ